MPDDRREFDRRSEARRAAAIDAAPYAVIAIDLYGRVLEFNRAAEATFGYRREEALRRGLVELIVPARSQEWILAKLARFRATGATALLGQQLRGCAVTADASELAVEFVAKRIPRVDPPELAIYFQATSLRRQIDGERSRYQHRLRALAAELLLTEERERQQLASDLHDGLCQTISLIQMKVASLHRPADPQLEQTLADISGLARDADRSARSIACELTPPVLHDLGLQPAVEWLIDNIQSRYGIDIELEDDGQPKPADERMRVILFRAIRELLINAAKHASATRVRVRLARERDRVNASVEDDGVGIDPNAAIAKGSGLLSIRERLNYVGGSLHIESSRGRGTRMRLSAPLAIESLQPTEVVP